MRLPTRLYREELLRKYVKILYVVIHFFLEINEKKENSKQDLVKDWTVHR